MERRVYQTLAEDLACAVIGYRLGVRPETVRRRYLTNGTLDETWYQLAEALANSLVADLLE